MAVSAEPTFILSNKILTIYDGGKVLAGLDIQYSSFEHAIFGDITKKTGGLKQPTLRVQVMRPTNPLGANCPERPTGRTSVGGRK